MKFIVSVYLIILCVLGQVFARSSEDCLALERASDSNISHHMVAWTQTRMADLNGAFVQQYPLMYRDYTQTTGNPVPISVRVRNQCDNDGVPCHWTKVLLKAWIAGITDSAMVTVFVNPNEEVLLTPSFIFNNNALVRIHVPKSVNIELRAYVLENDKEILFFSQSEPVMIHPIDVFHEENSEIKNMDLWYSVWVTPNMDSISDIHRQMSSLLPNNSVNPYQLYDGDRNIASSTKRLVKAVYDVLAEKHIRYVDDANSVDGGQKIRYPIISLRERQANCLESVVLFASILESLGLHPFIVLMPRHAFLGWYEDDEKTKMDFLETTMIMLDGNDFKTANETGIETYSNQVKLGNFKRGEAKIIEIDSARKYGVMPNEIP